MQDGSLDRRLDVPEMGLAAMQQLQANLAELRKQDPRNPEVQALIPRVADRRIITYGENPQADVRLTDLDHEGGRSKFTVQFRDRDGNTVDNPDSIYRVIPISGDERYEIRGRVGRIARRLPVPSVGGSPI